MEVEFSIQERVYNIALSGMEVKHDGNWEKILYVKVKKDIKSVVAHCVSGSVFLMNIDKPHIWNVNNENPELDINKKKLKGRFGKKI